MKKILVVVMVLISISAFAQSDMVKGQFAPQNPPSLSAIKLKSSSNQQSADYVADNLIAYSNQARLGLLMEGGGVVLGMGGALLSANSVSATPINISLIAGGLISIVGFFVHYDSYRFLKRASHSLKSK